MENNERTQCPYADKEKVTCTHPGCIRMPGLECEYKRRGIKLWKKKN